MSHFHHVGLVLTRAGAGLIDRVQGPITTATCWPGTLPAASSGKVLPDLRLAQSSLPPVLGEEGFL